MATITSGNPQFNIIPIMESTENTTPNFAKDGSSVKAHPDSGRRDGNIYYGEPKSKKEVVVEPEPVKKEVVAESKKVEDSPKSKKK